jgi:hypothetical protein
MTLLSALKLLLMALVSSKRWPSALLFAKRSDPARSTKLRVAVHASPVLLFFPVKVKRNRLWLRLEWALAAVLATDRVAAAC